MNDPQTDNAPAQKGGPNPNIPTAKGKDGPVTTTKGGFPVPTASPDRVRTARKLD